jgi:hypothetical protein
MNYLNQTGPGDYELPDMWVPHAQFGKTSVSFSFRKRCKQPYLGKGLTTDIVGKDAPSATSYDAHTYKTIEHNDGQKWKVGNETRFPNYFKSETRGTTHSYIALDYFPNSQLYGKGKIRKKIAQLERLS